MKPEITKKDAFRGLSTALIILGLWGVSLFYGLTLDLGDIPVPTVIMVFILQTFFYTGLFITAHDAIHGVVFPVNKSINKFFGILSVTLYALFNYKLLFAKHWDHHRYPGTSKDPDFNDGIHKGFWRWYFHFIFTYVNWKQILGMAIVFNILHHFLRIPVLNLLLFWVAPALLSTLQLFFFGTFLPHRETNEPFKDDHRARSNEYSTLLSFLTCYHFGYHWEHHEYPYLAWWKLPSSRKN